MTIGLSGSIANPGNYLRTSRNFPNDLQALTVELNKTYVDVATQVNNRISGVFGTNMTITGESWFVNGEGGRQQTLRRVYTINGAGSYPHGIKFATITAFTRIYGTFTDGTNYYPLPYVDVIAANNQVNIVLTPTNIVISAGAGAPPTVGAGLVVLEWLSQI